MVRSNEKAETKYETLRTCVSLKNQRNKLWERTKLRMFLWVLICLRIKFLRRREWGTRAKGYRGLKEALKVEQLRMRSRNGKNVG